MARNIQFQVLRGTQSNIPSDLAFGEMYFAIDTNNLFFGTPGMGLGYIQIGDTTQVNETLKKILLCMEATRRALVALACEGGKNKPTDFEPTVIDDEGGVDADLVSEI
jgi:hypothetical protein